MVRGRNSLWNLSLVSFHLLSLVIVYYDLAFGLFINHRHASNPKKEIEMITCTVNPICIYIQQ